MLSIAEQLSARRAAEAHAAEKARTDAQAAFWRLAVTAAERAEPATAADVEQLDVVLRVLGHSVDQFESAVAGIRELAHLAAQPSVDDAKAEARELRDRASELESKAAALRAEADRLVTEGQALVAVGREGVEEARGRLRNRTALSVSLRESGCPELAAMTARPEEPVRRFVRSEDECVDQDRRRIPAGTVFEWVGSGSLPPHLVETDEKGRPIAPVEQPVEAPVVEQAAAVAQPAGLGHEHFSVGGEA